MIVKLGVERRVRIVLLADGGESAVDNQTISIRVVTDDTSHDPHGNVTHFTRTGPVLLEIYNQTGKTAKVVTPVTETTT